MSTDAGSAEAGDLEDVGPGPDAGRIGQAPTTTDVDDPERSSRNTAAGTGAGQGRTQPAADDDSIDTSASIEPHNQGEV
jgi:hypothetical protein